MSDDNVIDLHPELDFEDNNIQMFMHCTLCLDERPANITPKEWSDTQAGWTRQGIQVWCNRHNCNILHIDFEGFKHPASTNRIPLPGEKT
jgi:hypothetical protein